MFDEGIPPLVDVTAFGNFWHGRKDKVTGFESRSGVPLSADLFVPFRSDAAYLKTLNHAHLVDFGMPVQETPEEESLLGMTRWNKAILFGLVKSYAIGGGGYGVIGPDSWPYQPPDGGVWRMRALQTGAYELSILASVLLPDMSAPETVIQTITSPVEFFGGLLVNFSPVDGGTAAVHIFTNEGDGYKVLDQIMEVRVLGGSGAGLCIGSQVLPTATIEVLYLPDDLIKITDDGYVTPSVAEFEVGPTVYTQGAPTGAVYLGNPEYFYEGEVKYPGATARDEVTDHTTAYVHRVAYSRTGDRAVLGHTYHLEGHAGYLEYIGWSNFKTVRAWTYEGTLQINAIIATWSTYLDTDRTTHGNYYQGYTTTTSLTRNGSVVAAVPVQGESRTAVFRAPMLPAQHTGLPSNIYTPSSTIVALTGFGTPTPTGSLDGYGNPTYSYVDKDAVLLGYVTADSVFMDVNNVDVHPLLNTPPIAIDPSNDEYLPTTEWYF